MKKFTHSILLNASTDEVFKYISTSSGIIKWFIGTCDYYDINGNIIDKSEPAGKGFKFRWKWLAKELEITGEILGCEINKKFSFTFGNSFNVTLLISSENNRTRLDLIQKYSPGSTQNDFSFINCCVCWVFFLTNLKSVIEHGIDLRETVSEDDSLVNR